MSNYRNIIAPSAQICKRIFHGWNSVPKDYRTRAAWKRQFFKIAKGETPSAVVVIEQTRKLTCTEDEAEYTVEKQYKLYHVSQTQPVKRTPLNTAQQEFHDRFIRHADCNKLIRWTKGEWTTTEDGEMRWDEAADVYGWRTYQEHLGLDQTIDHLNGKDIYGVFGDKTSSYLLIDLDLHNQPLDLFLRRLRVLLDAFHGRHRCHFQVSAEKAGGVHIILSFDKQGLLKNRRKWLLNELAKLDEKYPDVELTKVRGGKRILNIEVYPDRVKAHRLPLCRGRVMLLDRPLPLVHRRGKQVQDVVGYIGWLKDPNRQYLDKDAVYEFVVKRLDRTCSSDSARPEKETAAGGKTGKDCAGQTLPMKGRTRGAIVGFWLRGEPGHFRHLNAAIAVTLRALLAEGLGQDEAVDLVIKYVDQLRNVDLSSRLANNKPKIYDDLRRMANRIWQRNGGQVNSEQSSRKWRAVTERWREIGFRVSDRATWTEPHGSLGTVVDCEDFEFTEQERQLIIEGLAPVLVGKKQARKEAKQREVISAVRYFLRYVKCHDGEIAISALPVVLKDFSLNLRNHDKQQRFIDLLKEWRWIYVRADYFHPSIHGGNGAKGRARAYGVGGAMAAKFGNSPSYYNPQPDEIYILSPISSETDLGEVNIPSFDEQLAAHFPEVLSETQEMCLDEGSQPVSSTQQQEEIYILCSTFSEMSVGEEELPCFEDQLEELFHEFRSQNQEIVLNHW